MAGEEEKVERAVVAVVLEQAVEAEERREQRADPQDRRADARQEVEVGADAEGDDGDDREEEDQPDQRAAAGAELQARGLPGDAASARSCRSPEREGGGRASPAAPGGSPR